MSQEVKIEASGILTDEDEEDLQQDHQNNECSKQVNHDESIQNEETKIETNDDNQNKMQDESSQMNKHNFTSISKQIEDSDDINFHEESYNKEQILQNDDRYEEIEQQHMATEEDSNAKRNQIFSKEQMNRQLSNAIIEASSNSSQFTIQFSKTDEVKTKKSCSQDDYEVCDNNVSNTQMDSINKQQQQSVSEAKDQEESDKEKSQKAKQDDEEVEEEEKTAEDQVKANNKCNIYEQNNQASEQSQELFDQSQQNTNTEHKQLHKEEFGHQIGQNQAFDQKSPAQNTEIIQRNQKKGSIMIDHQVEDSMFHIENKNNNGDGKSSSASDNGEETIQNFNENQIPEHLRMMKNKSNDCEVYNKSGGNFWVSNMLQINQHQNDHPLQSSGGIVIVGGGTNSDNYSYNSPEIINAANEKKSSTPDIIEMNFTSSNQTNSFGFSKLSVEKISNKNDNNQNSNSNNNNNNNQLSQLNANGMLSIDSKQFSGSNSYELNYSIKMMHSSNDPTSIDDSKRIIKQFQSDQDDQQVASEEHNCEIILQQDPTSDFSKHLFQARADTFQQKNNTVASKQFNQTSKEQKDTQKKIQKNDYYIVSSDIQSEDQSKVEQTDNFNREKKKSLVKGQEETQKKQSYEKIFQTQKVSQNQQSANELFANFFNQSTNIKYESDQANFIQTEQQQYTMTGRNNETQAFANLKSEESAHHFDNTKDNKNLQEIQIRSIQLNDNSNLSIDNQQENSLKTNLGQLQKKKNNQQNKFKKSERPQSQQDHSKQNLQKIDQDNPGNVDVNANESTDTYQQNSSVIQSRRALERVNVFYKIFIIFNCVLYGYIIPQQLLPQSVPKQLISLYLIIWVFASCCIKKEVNFDFSICYRVGLSAANFFISESHSYFYSNLLNILFFGQFLFSLWSLRALSIRIRSITDVIQSSFKPNLEIFGFLVILILLFNISFNVFNLTELSPKGIYSFSSIEYFRYYVLTIYTSGSKIDSNNYENGYNLSQPQIYFAFACALVCLFFLKLVVENLLSIVQKVSQEQYYEYVGTHFSLGRFAIFKDNDNMNNLYNNKPLYSIIQGISIIAYSVYYYLDNTQDSFRFFSFFFIFYEIVIDKLMSNAISIFKNILYILVMFNPSYYRLFAIFIFYGICSHMTFFTAVSTHLATLLLDFTVIVFFNFVIYHAYIDCNSSSAISPYIPLALMFFFFQPMLKGMMLRYSEIFEIEEDEEAILSTLGTQFGQAKQPIQQGGENYDNFEDEIDLQDDSRTQDRQVLNNQSVNPYLDQSIQRNFIQNHSSNRSQDTKSFFLFSRRNCLRVACLKLVNSVLFCQMTSMLYLLISVKEIFYFLCSAFSINYHNDFNVIVSYFEKFVEPPLFALIILINSISYGLLFDRKSYLLKSLRNLIFFCICLIAYGIQPFFQNTYFGFLRVIFLMYLIPFGIKRLADIIQAISHSKKVLLQILFIFLSIYLIFVLFVQPSIKNQSDYVILFISQLLYLFSVNFFVSIILVEYSKQQLKYQNPNIIWTSIKQKIANHKFNFYFIKSRNINQQASIFHRFLKSKWHNFTVSLVTGLFYLSLFLIGIVEEYLPQDEYLYLTVENYQLKSIAIQGFSCLIFLYCLMHTHVYYNTPFSSLTTLNKTLLAQSLILSLIFVINIFSDVLKNENLQIQFLLQLPMLLRTKYMFPIIKFKKQIFRQALLTFTVSLTTIVCLSYYLENSSKSIIEYLLMIFNLNPNYFLIDQSQGYKNILYLIIIYSCNGILNTVIVLDIIRKFDLNESAQAKNKYKQIVAIFESTWDKYKFSQNGSLMKVSNLIYFLVKFDATMEEEEQIRQSNKKKKVSKLQYQKRIMNMKIKINEDSCLYYKDLLFYLISEKFNRIQTDQNYCYGSMSSFNNMNSSIFSNCTAEELELSQLSQRRRWKVYNPIKNHLYATLALQAWKKYTDIVLNSKNGEKSIFDETTEEQQKKDQYEEEEEDSIFFDPNIVPPETIQQQSLRSNFETK
ncbi:transmembrane protein, putative (macronuclear) [Tetrahymena thermophila SB210]|uniref:Transmembrane protein, putative n=1 Tax=Tetrahymena thermophila (strain SB210) TaxID=312017 RepID=Q237F6_TETTS|nr:transmembrane protein, putative [Tetrahymena thermophila SB210]EAR92785.2 transmembrane protein, putative [Tetrahymena thermophila SB210]|eukprot:XP_001013030.2 transmembrane protein, putative [Tetrahymena thermophila SB210]